LQRKKQRVVALGLYYTSGLANKEIDGNLKGRGHPEDLAVYWRIKQILNEV